MGECGKGMKVVINTNGRLKWADGKIGYVKEIDYNAGFDRDHPLWDELTLVVEGMDPKVPPYGLVRVRDFEIDPITAAAKPEIEEDKPENDPVNHPSHYTDGKYECIDFMESRGYTKDGYLFNAVKYISRAGKKDPAKYEEDISKAIWYLNRKINMAYIHPKDISTNAYIEDKGLENTLVGLALKMIEKQCYEEALMLLKLELVSSHQKHSS